MARIARIVVPNIPHHITQRGNRNQRVFFSDQDRRFYLSLLQTFSEFHGVDVWAYCLMDNHVHFVAVPANTESLGRCFQEVHQVYTRSINVREGWRGYLWQGRFSSFPMDERYLVAAMRYVENNSVRANMVQRALVHSIKSGRPAGSEEFIAQLEKDFGRSLKAKKAGRRPKKASAENSQKQLFVA